MWSAVGVRLSAFLSSLALRPFSLMHILFWPFDYFLPRPISRSLLHKCLRRNSHIFFISHLPRHRRHSAGAGVQAKKRGHGNMIDRLSIRTQQKGLSEIFTSILPKLA